MNENDQFADAALIRAVELQSVATWLLADWIERLQKLEKEIVAAVAIADPSNDAVAQHLDALIEEVRAKIQAVFEELIQRAEESFDELADIQSEFERNKFLVIFGISLAAGFVALKADDIEVMGLKIAEWLNRSASDLQLRASSAIRRGVAAGDSLPGLLARIKGNSTLIGESEISLVKPTINSIETLTRTAVEAVAARTRERAAENILPIVKVTPGATFEIPPAEPKTIRYGWQQISVLDSRTTQICRSYANKIWDKDFKPIGHNLPYNGGVPRHAFCRSVVRLLLLDSDPGTLQDFIDFMERQSETEKQNIFGSKAYRLWKTGKINDSDLLRSRERQLTFDELRKRNET